MSGRPINGDGFRNHQCKCGDYLETGATGNPSKPGEPLNEGFPGQKCETCGETGFQGQHGYEIGGVV